LLREALSCLPRDGWVYPTIPHLTLLSPTVEDGGREYKLLFIAIFPFENMDLRIFCYTIDRSVANANKAYKQWLTHTIVR